MSVMFSRVTLTADNGNTATLLCSGSPKDHYDLEDWTIYQKFMSDNLDSIPTSMAKARSLSPTFMRSPRLPAEVKSSLLTPMCIGRAVRSSWFILL